MWGEAPEAAVSSAVSAELTWASGLLLSHLLCSRVHKDIPVASASQDLDNPKGDSEEHWAKPQVTHSSRSAPSE